VKTFKFLALSLAAVLALPAAAQFRKPEDAVRYRQSVMNTMGFSLYNRLGGMVNNRIPFDAKLAQEHADVVVSLSKLPLKKAPRRGFSFFASSFSISWCNSAKFGSPT
jgi:cytochrome c556